LEQQGKDREMWAVETMPAAWPSLVGECVLMCKGDCRGSSDASSGYMLRFRAKVASRAGSPGKVWVSSTTSPRCSDWGRALSWPPRTPSTTVWSLVRRCDHGESGRLHFRRREP